MKQSGVSIASSKQRKLVQVCSFLLLFFVEPENTVFKALVRRSTPSRARSHVNDQRVRHAVSRRLAYSVYFVRFLFASLPREFWVTAREHLWVLRFSSLTVMLLLNPIAW